MARRAFRFAVQAFSAGSAAEWRDKARRAEALGYSALHLADQLPGSVPDLGAYPGADFWWGLGVGEAPAGFVDYARFLFVADGEKAREELGFEPRFTSREALTAFLEYRYPEAAARARIAEGQEAEI